MKKIAVLLLSALLVLSLCSCKSKEAQAVDDLILAIGEVSLESEEAIEKARVAYEELTKEDKSNVDNLPILEEALIKFEELQKKLTPIEEKLFEYILNIINKEDFETLSSVRILEIGDYVEWSKRKGTDSEESFYGPDLVVVHLQGTSNDFLDGSRVNPYYTVCLSSDENTSEYAKLQIEAIETTWTIQGPSYYDKAQSRLLKFVGEAGDYAYEGTSYEYREETTEMFSVKKLNLALDEYWKEKGF